MARGVGTIVQGRQLIEGQLLFQEYGNYPSCFLTLLLKEQNILYSLVTKNSERHKLAFRTT